MRADPDNRGMAKRLYCNLAYASFKRGNLEISIEEATAALLIDPDFVKMLVHRGKLYMHDDNYDLAVKDLSRAYRIESEFGKLFIILIQNETKYLRKTLFNLFFIFSLSNLFFLYCCY